MTVGELRNLLDGVDDDLEITVRARDDDNNYCGTITFAEVEHMCGGDDTPYFAIDCCPDDEEDEDDCEICKRRVPS